MTGDRLRKRVRRIVERDIAAGAHSTSLLHADILALLDADPDTPTTERCNCHQYGHARLCPVHTQEDFDAAEVTRERPDAPVDDGLVEQIANIAAEFISRYRYTGIKTSTIADDIARKVVVARPWQAEVER